MTENPASSIPHLNVHSAEFAPLPQMNGSEAVFYQSADGRRLAGSFKEAGKHEMMMPFDEFLYVVGGTADIAVDGAGALHLEAGDACYLLAGQQVTFDYSDDFHDVTVLISDTAIAY